MPGEELNWYLRPILVQELVLRDHRVSGIPTATSSLRCSADSTPPSKPVAVTLLADPGTGVLGRKTICAASTLSIPNLSRWIRLCMLNARMRAHKADHRPRGSPSRIWQCAQGTPRGRKPSWPHALFRASAVTVRAQTSSPSDRVGAGLLARLGQAWSRLWFQSSPTTPLELARIGIGAALLCPLSSWRRPISSIFGATQAGCRARSLAGVSQRILDAASQSVFFLFYGALAVDRFSHLFLALLPRVHAGLADVMGEVDRPGRPNLL